MTILGYLAGKKQQKAVNLNVIEGTTREVIGETVEAHKELSGAFRKWFTGQKVVSG